MTKTTMKDLVTRTIAWAEALDYIKQGQPRFQFLKVVEEFGELTMSYRDDAEMDLMDAVGDSLVTLVILLKQISSDLPFWAVEPGWEVMWQEVNARVDYARGRHFAIDMMPAMVKKDIYLGYLAEGLAKGEAPTELCAYIYWLVEFVMLVAATKELELVNCFEHAVLTIERRLKNNELALIDGVIVKQADLEGGNYLE